MAERRYINVGNKKYFVPGEISFTPDFSSKRDYRVTQRQYNGYLAAYSRRGWWELIGYPPVAERVGYYSLVRRARNESDLIFYKWLQYARNFRLSHSFGNRITDMELYNVIRRYRSFPENQTFTIYDYWLYYESDMSEDDFADNTMMVRTMSDDVRGNLIPYTVDGIFNGPRLRRRYTQDIESIANRGALSTSHGSIFRLGGVYVEPD